MSTFVVRIICMANLLTFMTKPISTTFPPVPKRLADKIWRGEYIELWELLPTQLGAAESTFLDLMSKSEKSKPKRVSTRFSNGPHVSICLLVL